VAEQDQLLVLKQGTSAWNEWRQANPEICTPNLRGADLTGAVLIGANLTEACLADADLGGAKLAGGDLFGADLAGAKLDEADLTAANLIGADLTAASLSETTLIKAKLWGAKLRGADLGGANLTDANLYEADLSEADLTSADVSGASLIRANVANARVNHVRWDKRRMRGRYLGLRGADSCYGNALFRRAALDQDFLDTLEEQWRGTWRMALFGAWALLDFGRSIGRVAGFVVAIWAIYGGIFSLWPEILSYDRNPRTPFTPFYFSIVTFTTLGFGDIKPANLMGELITSSEVIVGYIMLGLLLSVLAEKVARRS
jgi:uncharacterized protein YjbI with pentapeptide repeats